MKERIYGRGLGRDLSSKHFPVPDQQIDAAEPGCGHENHQPPGDRPADPDIEYRVEKGAVEKKNRKEIEQKPHDLITSS
jgi:hypothetical protein